MKTKLNRIKTALLCAVVLGLPWLATPAAVAAVFSNTGALNIARYNHTTTLLSNGKTLVTGGRDNSGNPLASAELYDPATGIWTPTGALGTMRYYHTATLLPNGKVLLSGGLGGASAELYDPVTGLWTPTGILNTARYYHTATLLPNGKVLVTGGLGGGASAELYDPATGAWTATAALNNARFEYTATLLPNGKMLVAGGIDGSAELYDPATGIWTNTAALNTVRYNHTATLLPNGRVLVAGGGGNSNALTSAELYDVGLGFNSSWQPQITTFTAPLLSGGTLTLTGARFRGLSGASSGGTQDSPSDNPVVQLRSLNSGQTLFLNATHWSTNSYTAALQTNLPAGPIMITMFVNGIPSSSIITTLNPLGYNQLFGQPLGGGKIQLIFVGNVGINYALERTFNLSPPALWVPQATNPAGTGGGLLFTNTPNSATNNFWRIRSLP